MTELKWPTETKHGVDGRHAGRAGTGIWRPPKVSEPEWGLFRTCWYCGSIHPEDLYRYMRAHVVRLETTDLKYGWPHKFYVKGIPNELAGQQVRIGTRHYGRESEEPIMGQAPEHAHAKFYNEHLAELEQPTFDALAAEIVRRTGWSFSMREGQLMYSSGSG
jgi:hypothetical protein